MSACPRSQGSLSRPMGPFSRGPVPASLREMVPGGRGPLSPPRFSGGGTSHCFWPPLRGGEKPLDPHPGRGGPPWAPLHHEGWKLDPFPPLEGGGKDLTRGCPLPFPMEGRIPGGSSVIYALGLVSRQPLFTAMQYCPTPAQGSTG